MPLAGQIVRAVDFTASTSAIQNADEAGITNVSPTYASGANLCSVIFVAPTSGKVLIVWGARMQSNTAAVRVLCSVQVRTGGTPDSGTIVSASTDVSAIESSNQQRIQASRQRVVSGLATGTTYNAVVQHTLSGAGTGDIFDRDIIVTPLP